jgi:hypothetical protein
MPDIRVKILENIYAMLSGSRARYGMENGKKLAKFEVGFVK